MKTLLLSLFILFSVSLYSQVDTNQVYNFVEEMPQFVGGEAAMTKYIAENLKYPPEAMNSFITGTVYIRFEVTRTGEVGEIHVFKSVDVLLDNEASRVISSFPNFIPGKQSGVPVNVWLMLPIKFDF